MRKLYYCAKSSEHCSIKQHEQCYYCNHFLIFTRYLDPDMYTMMEDNSDTIRSTKFKKLTQAICGLVSNAVEFFMFFSLDQHFSLLNNFPLWMNKVLICLFVCPD